MPQLNLASGILISMQDKGNVGTAPVDGKGRFKRQAECLGGLIRRNHSCYSEQPLHINMADLDY